MVAKKDETKVIKLRSALASANGVWELGDELEVSAAEAERFIAKGLATEVEKS